MSLLSVLRSGAEKFTYAAMKLEANAKAIYAALPVAFHPMIDAAVSLAKQGAGNAVAAADKAEGPILTAAATVIVGAFRGAVATYLGPGVAGVLTPPAADAIARFRDAMIAEIHTEALYAMAKLADPAMASSATASAAASAKVAGA